MVQTIIKEKNLDNKQVKIFVEDEGRFGRITSVGHGWAVVGHLSSCYTAAALWS